jgi:hypothetical protein
MIINGKKWIDEKLGFLDQAQKNFSINSKNFFFEPTESIYMKLESGDEYDLQSVANKIAKHIGIVPFPDVKYDWGLKMELDTAGKFSMTQSSRIIRIPFYYVGKKYSVGAILAHEITHAFLTYRGIIFSETRENEVFTDITSIYIGLGKLGLNGLIIATDDINNEIHSLGYLTPELFLYCFRIINEKKSIPNEIVLKNLNPTAKKIMEV